MKRTTINVPKDVYENFRLVCIHLDKKHTDELHKLMRVFCEKQAKKHNIQLKEPA
jgi:hypothetical protein